MTVQAKPDDLGALGARHVDEQTLPGETLLGHDGVSALTRLVDDDGERAPVSPGRRGSGAPAGALLAQALGAPTFTRDLRTTAGRWALRLGSLVVCFGFWHLVATHKVSLRVIDFANVPTPLEVLGSVRALAASPKLATHVASSCARVLAGFLLAAVAGIGLGLVTGRSKRAAELLLPPLEVLRPIPGVAWIPLAILMFPSSEGSMVFITFMGALFPILLNTLHGVQALEPRLEASARCLGARGWFVFRELVLPGALPQIFTGLGIGMGTAWFCLVTAEMISGQYGIGYYTWEAYNLQRYPDIVLGMLIIGVLGLGSSALVKVVGRWLTPWYGLRAESSPEAPASSRDRKRARAALWTDPRTRESTS